MQTETGVDQILDSNNQLLALVVRKEFHKPGITFLTPPDFSQQIGCLAHPTGKVIAPHVHNPVPRQVKLTQEVLFIRKGKLRVDFFEQDRNYIGSTLLKEGDTILLITGGHGFEVIEAADIIEVKQGPYVGEHDKTRFEPISADRVFWRE